MSNKKLIFPTTHLLPMEDLAQELKTIYNFQLRTDNAIDTETVFGVAASNIAVAATDDDGELIEYKDDEGGVIVPKRHTVMNAEKLGGKEPNFYMTTDEGKKVQKFGEEVSGTFSDEIAAIRDELYQLISHLSKNGTLHEHGSYSGFWDHFKTNNKQYVYKQKTEEDGQITDTFKICGLADGYYNPAPNVNKLVLDTPGLIKKGDWFVIRQADIDQNNLAIATDINVINNYEEVTFESTISKEGIPNINSPESVEIWKVLGDYYNGTFSYSRVEEHATTNTEKIVMLNDDSSTTLHSIVSSDTGFGTSFKVPDGFNGAINYFSVFARSTGVPGAMKCYILKETDVGNIVDLESEEAKQYIIAESALVGHSNGSSVLQEVQFKFTDPHSYKKIILDKTRYAFVIVAKNVDQFNKWEIQFGNAMNNSQNPDLQTNNKTYNYIKDSGLQTSGALGDIIFMLSFMEIKDNYETPMVEGVYTSKPIKISYNNNLARARLTLRINREGLYKATTSGIVPDNGTINFENEKENPGAIPSNFGMAKDDIVVIGNQFRKLISDCNGSNITIDKAISVDQGAEIYRVGYKPYLRAVKKEWKTGAETGYVVTNDVVLPMELKAVMKDTFKEDGTQSERLVFECEFREENGTPIDSNEFTLQIVWKSNVPKSGIVSNKDFVGRIHDMYLTFDRTL